MHPKEQCCDLLSYAGVPPVQRCNLLSYTAPYWATLHPNELHLTLNELSGTLKNKMSPVPRPAHSSFVDPSGEIIINDI